MELGCNRHGSVTHCAENLIGCTVARPDDMDSYEGNVLQLVMRYLDVAQAHLLDHDMDGVGGIQNSRRALIKAQNAVNGLFQTQIEHSAIGSLASTGQRHRAASGA